MIKEYFEFGWASIRQRGVRSWLTIIGIVIGVAAIVSLITIGQGMKNAVEDQFESLGIRNIRVVPASLQGPPSSFFTLPNKMADRIEKFSIVEYVDRVMIGSETVVFSGEENFASVFGYDTALADKGFADLNIKPEKGRFFQPNDRGLVIAGNVFAKETFSKELSERSKLKIGNKTFKVVGVFEKTGTNVDERLYLPLEDAREIFNRPDDLNVIVITVKDGIEINKARDSIEESLLREYDEEEFDILTPQQILEQINNILGVVQTVFAGIAAISLVVGGIGIMNSMFTSVLERTRDIGVMKSVGAKDTDIALLFLIEAGIIGLVGGIIGVLIGTLLAFLVGSGASAFGFPLLKIEIDLQIIAASLAFSFFVGTLAGLLPALQASKLKPVDALRYE